MMLEKLEPDYGKPSRLFDTYIASIFKMFLFGNNLKCIEKSKGQNKELFPP